ncbi:HDOD domain-containing protein [Spirochaetota bacterium]
MIDTSKLASTFTKDREISISFAYPSDEVFLSVNSLIAKILSQEDKIYLLDSVCSIIRETILNAVKANFKRVFFKSSGLDIHTPKDYVKGMREFKKSVIIGQDNFRGEITDSEYIVDMRITKSPDGITIAIVNNFKVLPVELERIKFRIMTAKKAHNFSEAYGSVSDKTEGAGLGIILSVFLLKNAGIDSNSYIVTGDNESFSTSFQIPANIKKIEATSSIKEKIINDVNAFPTFPKKIMKMQSLCNEPEVEIDEITSEIILDPSLTADVLKLANSAGFITAKRIENIKDAIIKIGLKNLKSILTATTARKILDDRYSKFEKIWDHCNKAAFYARDISLEMGMPSIADNVFISGLLHDIGKIVLLSADMKLVDEISEIASSRRISATSIIEEISIGISHVTIGKLIAEKWNFPDYLVEAINGHHAPLNALTRHRDVVDIVYLANLLCGIEDEKYNFHFIETEILEKLKITKKNDFNEFRKNLKNKYVKNLSSK